jgi:hypothetical protein
MWLAATSVATVGDNVLFNRTKKDFSVGSAKKGTARVNCMGIEIEAGGCAPNGGELGTRVTPVVAD